MAEKKCCARREGVQGEGPWRRFRITYRHHVSCHVAGHVVAVVAVAVFFSALALRISLTLGTLRLRSRTAAAAADTFAAAAAAASAATAAAMNVVQDKGVVRRR